MITTNNTTIFEALSEVSNTESTFKSLDDVKIIKLNPHTSRKGNLVAVEGGSTIPFEVKRVFYIYGVADQEKRGRHAHKTTEQFLICLSGECKVICSDGDNFKEVVLNSPATGLYIPKDIWDEQLYTTPDTLLLVLSNTHYNRNDYIENFEEFKEYRNGPI